MTKKVETRDEAKWRPERDIKRVDSTSTAYLSAAELVSRHSYSMCRGEPSSLRR
jgi:hypothetical protein